MMSQTREANLLGRWWNALIETSARPWRFTMQRLGAQCQICAVDPLGKGTDALDKFDHRYGL